MRYWDWEEWVMWAIFVLFVAIFVLIGFGIYHEMTSEKIEITKSDWTCTDTETTTQFIMIGKILTPQSFTQCVEYKKNGD